MSDAPPRSRALPRTHPGEILREDVLPALGRSKVEVARLLGVSRQTLYDVLNERQPVTPALAVRIGKLCGNGAAVWLRLQQAHDLQKAETELAEVVASIPTLQAREAA